MWKKWVFMFTAIFMIALFAGCSSSAEDELVTLQNDMKDNIGEPLSDIEEEFDQKSGEVDSGGLTPDDFVTYYDEEVQPAIDEMRQYIDDYDEPTTEDAKEYYTVLTDGLYLALDMLDKFAEFMTVLVDESASEDDIFEIGSEIDQLIEGLDEKDKELQKLKKKLEEEYDIEFEEFNLE